MKVALVHDWLTGLRGGERCLKVFLGMYPEADIFTLIHVKGRVGEDIDRAVKKTSFLQNLPAVEKYYRTLLPLFPGAISRFDFTGYDLVISLSHAAAKNIRVPNGVPHLCYCFTPMRYIWDEVWSYFGVMTPALWPAIWGLRKWDVKGSLSPDIFVAISNFVAARVRKYYHRRAEVVFPPVDTSWISPISAKTQGEAFLYAGALVPYKRPDLVIDAFNQSGEKLWVAGSGPLEAKLRHVARSNITFLGRLSDTEMARVFARSRALIFPGTEDFGMIPVEFMAAGRPVIGLHSGGLKETVKGLRPWAKNIEADGALAFAEATGVFIPNGGAQNVGALNSAIRYFMDHEDKFEPLSCVSQAQKFSVANFTKGWKKVGSFDAKAETTAL